MGNRRQARVKSVLPVRIWWTESSGTRHSHLTHTLDVNPGGARLGGVREPISIGDVVTLQYKQRRADFRVAWVGKVGSPSEYQVGLASLEPERYIWGELPIEPYADDYVAPAASQPAAASTPPQTARPTPAPDVRAAPAVLPLAPSAAKAEITRRLQLATAELCEIEELIKAGDVEPAMLNEFREALALARHTAWGVQQWFELQQRGDQQFPLLSFLIKEKLVVATRLCHQLTRDVMELSVEVEPASMEALLKAVEELADGLSGLQPRPGAVGVSDAKSAETERSLQASIPQIQPAPEAEPAEAALRRLSPAEVMDTLVQRVLVTTAADGVAVALTDGSELVCRASAGIAPDLGVRWYANSGLSGEALRTRESVHCDDTESDPRVDPVLCRAANLRSCLIVPIFVRGLVKGTIEAYSSRPRAFSPDGAQALASVAGFLGSMFSDEKSAC